MVIYGEQECKMTRIPHSDLFHMITIYTPPPPSRPRVQHHSSYNTFTQSDAASELVIVELYNLVALNSFPSFGRA